MTDSLSLEETNRVRLSLGLAPLTDNPDEVDPDLPPDEDTLAETNYAEIRARDKAEREARAAKERLDKARNQRELRSKLQGKGIAEGEDEGAKDWIKASRRREKQVKLELERARQREAEMQERDAYTEAELAGLRVGHDADDFVEGEDTILTLKDAGVLGDEDDELQNVNLAEHKRTTDRIDQNKRAKQTYKGYDEQGDGVLAKYDDEYEGKAKDVEGFRLGAPVQSRDVDMAPAPVSKEANRTLLSLDYVSTIANDYLQEGDVGFKKPKKKKKTKGKAREIEADDDIVIDNSISTVERRLAKEGPAARDAVIDDDDLQAALARQRKSKNRRRVVKLAEHDMAQPDAMQIDPKEEDDTGLVLDDTSEFIRNIAYRSADELRPVLPKAEVKEEPLELEDVQMVDEEEGEIEDEPYFPPEEPKPSPPPPQPDDEFGATAEEKYVSGGMAATLGLLRQSGLLKTMTPEEAEKDRQFKERDAWIARQRRKDEEREAERLAAKNAGDRRSLEQRERDNRIRQAQIAKDSLDAFKDYKPVVELKYHDAEGRQLKPKEAWKELSHRFHGKGSGTKKRQQQLNKINDEKRREAMVAGDTSSVNEAFQVRQERLGTATMVLAVGNNNSAPQQADFLIASGQSSAKAKTDPKKGKARATTTSFVPKTVKAAQQAAQTAAAHTSNLTPSLTLPSAQNGSPAPDGQPKGFVKVTAAETAAGSGAPETYQPQKIGVQLKRKADEEATGSPGAKRRA